MPPDKEAPRSGFPHPAGDATLTSTPATTTKQEATLNISDTARQCVSSQQVSWWAVREFVAAVLEQANGWPLLGTPAWCSLAHDDPQKWAALLDAAQHWALRLETCQRELAQASRDVSDAADWSAIATAIFARHNSGYIPREVA
jgi:hypothetical protein